MSAPPAGPLLALDTSTAVGSVAVGEDGAASAEEVIRMGKQSSAELLPAIDRVLRAAGLQPADLAGVVVGGGPGSFTGVRVAAATAKGLAHALEIPLRAPSSLLAVAAVCAADPREVCALFDARRGDVYAAAYRFGGGVPQERLAPVAIALHELLARYRDAEPPLFTGEGALLHAARIREELNAEIAPAHLAVPRASALLWAACAAPELTRVVDAAAWEPLYLRAAGAERIAAAGR
ncbi:tRNA (adenosine(37)-N6)-threonylcarbamoyltransferase complex dimerization subunit type 1 TsaB [soil metagenome]|jgi:tRNA threonylcarbamoyladenosine biosynthesis protein TsaB